MSTQILTHFEKVCEFNKAFDYNVYNIHNGNPLEIYPKDAQYRYDLIYEEGIVELGRAIRMNDIKEIKDALGDLLYVLYGACYTYNFNPDLFLPFMKCDNIIQYSYIEYEIEQLKKCLIDYKNIISTYSALLKVIMYTYNFADNMINEIGSIDSIFNIIHSSNMSKLCKTEQEAIITVDLYINKYEVHCNNYINTCNKYGKDSSEALAVYSPYDSPYYYKSGEYWLVKNKSTGKALKSINYTPVLFTI